MLRQDICDLSEILEPSFAARGWVRRYYYNSRKSAGDPYYFMKSGLNQDFYIDFNRDYILIPHYTIVATWWSQHHPPRIKIYYNDPDYMSKMLDCLGPES